MLPCRGVQQHVSADAKCGRAPGRLARIQPQYGKAGVSRINVFGSVLIVFAGCRHSSRLELPSAATLALLSFLVWSGSTKCRYQSMSASQRTQLCADLGVPCLHLRSYTRCDLAQVHSSDHNSMRFQTEAGTIMQKNYRLSRSACVLLLSTPDVAHYPVAHVLSCSWFWSTFVLHHLGRWLDRC